MKTLNYVLALASVTAVLSLSAGRLEAQQPPQGRGNFDPEQARQRRMERLKEQFDVKSDDEWKVIQERIEKVDQARREVGFGGGVGAMGFGRQGRGGGSGNGNNTPQSADAQGGRRGGGRGGFGQAASPEAEALQKAVESKAPADELKAKLAKLREARKEKEAALEKAQEDLRKVLSVRQEAAAVLAGLLK